MLRDHEYVAGSAAPVLIVVPDLPARFGGDRHARLADQRARRLVRHTVKACVPDVTILILLVASEIATQL